MAPHIQPQSLVATALKNVTNIIVKSCVTIECSFGSFHNSPCQQAVSELQTYLLQEVRPFLDCICDKVTHDDLKVLDDKRIFYALIVHRRTKQLNINCLLSRHSADFKHYQTFCMEQTSKLDNLVSLHICQINASNKVLKTIADTCYKSLEAITITPVLRELTDGLLCLIKCKELKYLKILAFSTNISPDNPLERERLRLLIKSLPKLEFFHSGNMVKILSDKVDQRLSLTKLRECDTKLNDISHVIKICPKVMDLDISVRSPSVYEAPDILNAISSSSWCLTSLALRGFSCQSQINQLLTAKGSSLVSINLDNSLHAVTRMDISTIGKCCPNLKTLDLDFSDKSFVDNTDDATNTVPMFTKLESLCLGWYTIDLHSQSILPLILPDASELNSLKLQCFTTLRTQDPLSDLLNSTSLTMLTDFSLIENGPGVISHHSISCLIERCEKLRKCYIFCRIDQEARSFLQELQGRIQDENLDLQFDVFD